MFPTIVMSKERALNGPPLITHEGDKLTRAGALIEARKLWGDLGTISFSDSHPTLMIWQIGEFHKTVGRGRTWEQALANSTRKKLAANRRKK